MLSICIVSVNHSAILLANICFILMALDQQILVLLLSFRKMLLTLSIETH